MKYLTLHDILRQRLLACTRLSQKLPPIKQIKQSQWSTRFEKLQRNRMVMGAFRYGLICNQTTVPIQNRYKNCPSIIERIKQYIQDGNKEHLVDAANLCMIEFEVPSIPRTHFTSVDDGIHTTR